MDQKINNVEHISKWKISFVGKREEKFCYVIKFNPLAKINGQLY
jgi:hypothetical protein